VIAASSVLYSTLEDRLTGKSEKGNFRFSCNLRLVIEGSNGEIDWCIMDDDMDFDGFI